VALTSVVGVGTGIGVGIGVRVGVGVCVGVGAGVDVAGVITDVRVALVELECWTAKL
jgi:hypothetical protein